MLVECPTKKRENVNTAESTGEVIPENKRERSISSIDSSVLKNRDNDIRAKSVFSWFSMSIIKSAIVEMSVTMTLAAVKPKDLPMIISPVFMGLGSIKKKVFRSISLYISIEPINIAMNI
jgi:hypothetical protein